MTLKLQYVITIILIYKLNIWPNCYVMIKLKFSLILHHFGIQICRQAYTNNIGTAKQITNIKVRK